jgi:hypothetical protein
VWVERIEHRDGARREPERDQEDEGAERVLAQDVRAAADAEGEPPVGRRVRDGGNRERNRVGRGRRE